MRDKHNGEDESSIFYSLLSSSSKNGGLTQGSEPEKFIMMACLLNRRAARPGRRSGYSRHLHRQLLRLEAGYHLAIAYKQQYDGL